MKTIAITSGKGGVGKSNLSANLAISLASQGQRTTVFDADLGLANLDVVLGVRPEFTLHDVITGEKRIVEILQKGPGGINYVAGGSGIEALARMTGPQLEAFLTELSRLEHMTDFLIFDTGAGLGEDVLMFCEASDEVYLVVTPDPASLADAYAIAKTLLNRDPYKRISVLMNMVNDEAQAKQVFARIYSICKQFLNKSVYYKGYVRFDNDAQACIRARQPFVLAKPNCIAARDLGNIAKQALGLQVHSGGGSLLERFRTALFNKQKKAA